jgi:hypothetical protein
MHRQQELLTGFDIAGGVCRIECRDHAFWDLLSPRYGDFASVETPTISLRVDLIEPPVDDVVARWPGPFARFSGGDGRLTVEGAGFHGVFDERASEGWIKQPPDPAPFETFLTAICARRLLRHDGFMLHAAALVAPDSRSEAAAGRSEAPVGARVFFGPSGSGKTTVSELIGEGVISDEITVIRRDGDRYRVSGVPWRGSRLEGELAGLFALRQASETVFTPLAPAETVRRLLGSVFFARADGGEITRFLATAEHLVSTVAGYEMRFTRDRAFWSAVPGRNRGALGSARGDR